MMTTLFDSADGRTFAVIEMGHCPKHGDFPAVMAEVNSDDSLGDSTRRFSCPACRKEQKEIEVFGTVNLPRRFWGKTFDNFEVTEDNRSALAFFRNYAEHIDERIESGSCIVLTGRPGTGKTHLACALLSEAIRKGRTGRFTSVAALFRAIRDTWRSGSQCTETQMIAHYVNLDLLVIDEVGVQAKSENERNLLFAVINGRYEAMRPTVIISNETLSEVKEILGERAFDRLREGGGCAFSFDCDSYRPRAKSAQSTVRTGFKFYQRELRARDSSALN